MKSSLGKLGVILIGLAIFGYAEAWGADWKFCAQNDSGNWFYDAEGITRLSNNIIRVWIKTVHTEKGVISIVAEYGSRYENLEQSLGLFEFNCLDKMGRVLAQTHYSKSGKVIDSQQDNTAKWEFFAPGTNMEGLYKAVCK
jgi:hypothetical protein